MRPVARGPAFRREVGRPLRVLVLLASANEARAAVPVAVALRERYGCVVRYVHLGRQGNGDIARHLREHGVPARVVGLTTALVPELAARRYDLLLMGNDNLLPNTLMIDAFRRAGRLTALIQEGIIAWGERSAGVGMRRLDRNNAPRLLSKALYAAVNVRPSRWRALAGKVGDARGRSYGSGGADRLFVASPFDDQLSSVITRAWTDIVCTGVPGFGHCSPQPAVRTRGSRRVLMVTSPIYRAGRLSRTAYEGVVASVRQDLVDSPVVAEVRLRRHPSESTPPTTSLAQDLAWADVVVIPYPSTVVFEALGARRPVLTYGPGWALTNHPVYQFVVTAMTKPWDDSSGASQAAAELAPEEIERQLDSYKRVWGLCDDGLAAERIAEHLCGQSRGAVRR